MICKTCKTEVEWRMHDCKRSIAEYLGCEKCDNWCTACRENWNVELNDGDDIKLQKPKANKKFNVNSKDLQTKQQKSKRKVKKKTRPM